MSLGHSFDGFIVDLDGVVYVGQTPVPGAPEALAALQAMGKAVVFVTNDPRSSRAAFAARLRHLGVPASDWQVVTCGTATADYLRSVGSPPTYVVGSAGLESEIARAGCRLVDASAAHTASAAVIGCHEGLCYEELAAATRAVGAGAELLATNRDATFPTPAGPAPATGAIVAAVETATGRRARVLGKPGRQIFHTALGLLGRAKRIAVVGDSLQSDIAGGRAVGLSTILVLTGSSRAEDIDRSATRPDAVLPALRDLVG